MITLAAFLSAVSFGQLLEPQPESLKTCTVLGCSTQAVVSLRRSDGKRPDLDIGLEIDGVKVTCRLHDLVDYGPVGVNCGKRVSLTQDTVSWPPGTTSGTYEERIAVFGKPAKIKVTVLHNKTTVGTKSFTPTFKPVYSNGKDCGVTCEISQEIWTLP